MVAKVIIINGPNLNLLGQRQPEIYGNVTLEQIEKISKDEAKKVGVELQFQQSNDESEIINAIQSAHGKYNGIIINAAAYTHTSVAIMDALLACNLPTVEVHLSNIYKREEFRHKSFVSPVAVGVICGFGAESYRLAVQAISTILNK
jgi:3-dehydroquinate dehydratase-2